MLNMFPRISQHAYITRVNITTQAQHSIQHSSQEAQVFNFEFTTPKKPSSEGMFSCTLTIEASIADLQPLIMCTTDGQSCIALGGDTRIKFVLSVVLLDLMSGARRRYSSDSQTMGGTLVTVLI
jgi:hypothetical protein